MTDQTPRTKAADLPDSRSSRHSRLAALCAVALVSISGSLLMEFASAERLGVPFSVSWMFGPPGTISVR